MLHTGGLNIIIIIIIIIIINTKFVQVTSFQGRGRLFIREALQHRLLVNTIELLADNPSLMSVSFIKSSIMRFLILDTTLHRAWKKGPMYSILAVTLTNLGVLLLC